MCPDVFSSEPGSRAFPMRCDDDFDATQRLYTESFTAFDAETFRRLHHPEAVAVLPDGGIRRGVEPIMAALATHFEKRAAVCAWNEVHRFVDDCRAAYIAYVTDYAASRDDDVVHLLRSVTHVHEQGRWLVIADQATVVEQ